MCALTTAVASSGLLRLVSRPAPRQGHRADGTRGEDLRPLPVGQRLLRGFGGCTDRLCAVGARTCGRVRQRRAAAACGHTVGHTHGQGSQPRFSPPQGRALLSYAWPARNCMSPSQPSRRSAAGFLFDKHALIHVAAAMFMRAPPSDDGRGLEVIHHVSSPLDGTGSVTEPWMYRPGASRDHALPLPGLRRTPARRAHAPNRRKVDMSLCSGTCEACPPAWASPRNCRLLGVDQMWPEFGHI